MFDIKLIREDPELVKENMRRKQREDVDLIDKISSLDESWRGLKKQVDDLRHERNKISKEINELKKVGKDASEVLSRAKQIPEEMKKLEEQADTKFKKIQALLKTVPNILHADVPIGKDETENVQVQTFGPAPRQDDVIAHQVIAEQLGVADFDSALRASGSGFYYLEGDLALLSQALIQFAIKTMINKGYHYVETPLMLRGRVIDYVTDLNDKENQVFKIDGEDRYLIGTSEHALIGRFIDQMIHENNLPIKQTSYSMCFRKEKGAHGLDEKGLFRTHQFNKVEMIVICKPEESMKFFEEMWNITVEIFTALEIPTRTLNICTGDLGDLKHIMYDIEAWSPRRKQYIEVGSCSNLTSAQARGLGIRATNGKDKYTPHTLNNTAIATSRAMVAILENNQNADGSVTIPKVLRPFMGGKEKISKA